MSSPSYTPPLPPLLANVFSCTSSTLSELLNAQRLLCLKSTSLSSCSISLGHFLYYLHLCPWGSQDRSRCVLNIPTKHKSIPSRGRLLICLFRDNSWCVCCVILVSTSWLWSWQHRICPLLAEVQKTLPVQPHSFVVAGWKSLASDLFQHNHSFYDVAQTNINDPIIRRAHTHCPNPPNISLWKEKF